jgi:glycine betaine catabolism B
MPEKLLNKGFIKVRMVILHNSKEELIKAEIIEIIQEIPDVKTFRLKLVKPFAFLPGQFIFVHMTLNNEKLKRAYSIASSPLDKEFIEITIKKQTPGTFSVYMVDSAKEGDLLEISGPFGKFNYQDTLKEVVFIAGGVGVAPFRGIIRYILQKKLPTKVTLLYSTRTRNEIIYRNELDSINSHNIKIKYTLTRDETWDGHKGRIDEAFILENLNNAKDKIYFLCGPLEFIRSTVDILITMGVDNTSIKRDVW